MPDYAIYVHDTENVMRITPTKALPNTMYKWLFIS